MTHRSSIGRVAALILPLVLAAVAAAGATAQSPGLETPEPPEPVEPLLPYRNWLFATSDTNFRTIDIFDKKFQVGGEVRRAWRFAPANPTFEQDNGKSPGVAMGEVYSSESGETFWAFVEAPAANPGGQRIPTTAESVLEQRQGYVKRTADATLQIILSEGFLAAADVNGRRPLPTECWFPNHFPDFDGYSIPEIKNVCAPIRLSIGFRAKAYVGPIQPNRPLSNEPESGTFFDVGGEAILQGWEGYWDFFARPEAAWSSDLPLWSDADFTVTERHGSRPRASLNGPLILDVDLSGVEVCAPGIPVENCGDRRFTLYSYVSATAGNARARESGAAAYLRDPRGTGGTEFRMSGLEATNDPDPLQPIGVEPPVPCESGPNPQAGILQFSSGAYSVQEHPLSDPGVTVTRTQGSEGPVSARLALTDDSAAAGTDYEASDLAVGFGDGDTAPRHIEFAALADDDEEPDETVRVTLSEAGGCASLGPRSAAAVTIVDNDKPVEVPGGPFTVGGTVTGMADGARMVLEDHHGIFLEVTENGPFTFDDFKTDAGEPYSVTVYHQPAYEPFQWIQFCSVTNGSGTFTDHDVTDVQVTCVYQ